MRIWQYCLSIGLVSATMSYAEELAGDYVYYNLDMKGSKVIGRMIVGRVSDGEVVPGGYSVQRVMAFIAEDCASGKLRNIKFGDRTHLKKKRLVQQTFSATCIGGPHPSIGAERKVKVRVLRKSDDRDLARYEFVKDEEDVVLERYR